MLAGVRRHRFTNTEAFDAGAQFDDLAAELMAEDALALDPGQRVWRIHRDKNRPGHVFMQVGSADAAPLHADLHPTGGRRNRQWHVFDADVVAAMPDGGAHAASRLD
ncbi:hypothetical protein D3C84_631210 [compost metagenome]